MCGIIGHCGPEARRFVSRVERAREAMLHRGPDDAGLWSDDRVVLGSRRLAILDLSPTGHMPACMTGGGWSSMDTSGLRRFWRRRINAAFTVIR